MDIRRGYLLLIAGAILLSLLVVGCARTKKTNTTADTTTEKFPVTVTDSLNHTVTVPEKPQRIVSIAPSATEILFALGVGKRVVADTTYCDYPAEAATLPKIGGYSNPDVEKILALSPDLVIGARGNPKNLLTQLDSLKIPVAAVDAEKSIDEMLQSIALIGWMVGEGKAAETLQASLRERRQAIADKTASLTDKQRPRVLFLFDTEALFSAGTDCFIDEIITEAGGRNIAAKTKQSWPELSMEMVLEEDPEVILVLTGVMSGKKQSLTAAEAVKRFRAKARWKGISAVKEGRVAVLEDDSMTLPGPRLIDGLEDTAAAIHPKLFSAGEDK